MTDDLLAALVMGAFGIFLALPLLYYGWRFWMVTTGRAKPLPDIHPDRDEASAPEPFGSVISQHGFAAWQEQQLAIHAARMQGNSAAREWPLPRRAAE